MLTYVTAIHPAFPMIRQSYFARVDSFTSTCNSFQICQISFLTKIKHLDNSKVDYLDTKTQFSAFSSFHTFSPITPG